MDCAVREVLNLSDDETYTQEDAAAIQWPFGTLVRAAAAAVADVYAHPRGLVGAYCHIVTDDYNVEDSNLAFCCRQLADLEETYGAEIRGLCALALALLWPLTRAERATALALADGYINDESQAVTA